MQYFRVVAAVLAFSLMQPASSRRIAMNDALAAPVSQLSFSITNTLCGNPALSILKGVFSENAKTTRPILAEGLRLANEQNCRLCDITGEQGQKNDIMITCAAQRVDIDSEEFLDTCHTINGRPGWRTGADICIPCPDECETCKTGFGAKFKCILPEKGSSSVPAPWTCDAVKTKTKPPIRSQSCKYRSNLLSTASKHPPRASKVKLIFAALPCNGTPDTKSTGIVADIMGVASPSLAKAHQDNCALCRLTANGTISSEYSEEFQSYKHAIGPKLSAEGACGLDTIGWRACRNDQGKTLWSKNKPCLPCPFECYSCEEKSWSRKGFTCKVLPPTPLEVQLNHTLTNGMSSADETAMIKLPKGYDCEQPKKRSCKAGLCGTYKVWCKYKELS